FVILLSSIQHRKYLYCIAPIFSIAAFTLAFVGTSCHYLQFTSSIETVNNLDSGENEPVSLHFGYWYYQSWQVAPNSTAVIEESCHLYPSSITIDNNWKAARGFNLIAIIIGGSLILLDIFQGCLSTKRNRSLRMVAIGYLICCISSGFSLLLLDSNVCKNNTLIEELNQLLPNAAQFQETCSISKGGKSTIASTVMWFVAAVGTALLHPVHKKLEEERNAVHDDGLDEPLFIDDINIL
ncbi:hypothetical protein ACHAXR_009851, partial [Thalassiosira sp. AJA248-18]